MPDLLPNAENARIEPAKLRDYALNSEHQMGRYKAAFVAQMGYTAADWQQLAYDIREQHLTQSAETGQSSPHGRKYTITAPLVGPRGAARQVTTVWIVRPGSDWAEVVTIEPAAARKTN